ncbi:tyrosine-protein phosphatase [Streptacidiphilus neutrinimicus]|uniref:tyrosine-protein phosphatase n=1 Tax=Streptacidiphilus neutrinimicus TaxID=105420 RepID=UPI0005A89080|nr:tyrosine-protein phosphatase [Streptacidiphilus neutrinimicus]
MAGSAALQTLGINFRPVHCPHLRPGLLHRAADLRGLSADECRRLSTDHGVRAVLDLRSAAERERDGLPATAAPGLGLTDHHVPITGYPHDPIATPRPGAGDYARYYTGMVERSDAGQLRTLFATVAAVAHRPFLLACYCGKDRTGVVTAALMTLAGCDDVCVAVEYGRTADALLPHVDHFSRLWTGYGHTREDFVARLQQTRQETMLLFLDAMRREHGGLVPALLARGVSGTDLDRIRVLLAAGATA